MPEHHIPEEHLEKPSQALIIAVQPPALSDADFQASLAELERLAGTLGITVAATETQKRPSTGSANYLGSGKLKELAALTGGPGEPGLIEEEESGEKSDYEPAVDLVLVDDDLSPRQQRNLELALGVPVMDRTAVILEIFESRARTKEARLQVEIARLKYELPRQRDAGGGDDRQGGGGRGERGHTNVELSKSRIRDRIAQLTGELQAVQASEATRRERREDTFQAALVGYTNAGKSTLMRALTGSEVLVEDKLFATLGTTVRQLQPPVTPQVLISDTVGFIKNLPHELVASFRSTLEEARDASYLLLVVDASDPDWPDQLEVTRKTLKSIDADEIPTRVVLNKVDGLSPQTRLALTESMPEALQISALNPADVKRLHAAIVQARDETLSVETLLVPYSQGTLVGEIHRHAKVLDEEHTSEGTLLKIRARQEYLGRWKGMLAR